MRKAYTHKQIVEAVNYWNKQLKKLDEAEFVQSKTTYVEPRSGDTLKVSDLVRLAKLGIKVGNGPVQIAGLVSNDDNDLDCSLNFIGGFVNSIQLVDGKCVLTLAPYRSGSRKEDLSIGPGTPLTVDQLLVQASQLKKTALVAVKMKDPYGMGPHVGQIIEAPVFAGKVTSRAYSGVFLYISVERAPVVSESEINEVQHDGTHVPRYPTRRIETDKPTVYYIGVDEYSDNFSQYGQYVMPNGGLTQDASSSSFKRAAVTKVPAALKVMLDKVVAKHGADKYIFVFKEEYSYGNQTHKRHARPAVIDIWYPRGQYWKYGFQPLSSRI